MKILLLLDQFQNDEATSLALLLCERLVAMRGLNLSALALGEDGPAAERLREMGIGARALGLRGVKGLAALRQAGRAVMNRGEHPDVMHSFCAWPAIGARMLHGGRENSPALCLQPVTERPRRRPELLLSMAERCAERFSRARPQVVLAPTEGVARELRSAGVPRVRVLPPGIDALKQHPLSENGRERYRRLLNVSPEAPFLLFSGRTHGRLEADALAVLDAFEELHRRHPQYRLHLLGENFPQRVRQRAESLAPMVRVLSSVHAIGGKLYGSADLVLRSTAPGLYPRGVAEAQACGAPVIAFVDPRSGPIAGTAPTGLHAPDPADPLHHAILRPHQPDPSELATLIEGLIANQEGRAARASAAREAVLEHAEVGATVDALVGLWRELAPDALWRGTDSIPLIELEELQRDATR
jgi:glycosyltransferase involved in cell wall biosynthesis